MAPPGFISTRPDYQQQCNNWSPEFREHFANNIVMRGIGVPTETADTATSLASNHASRTPAQIIAVTGNPLG
jgi:hypothetical protein